MMQILPVALEVVVCYLQPQQSTTTYNYMKFMELDEGGFIHHVMNDPGISMIPVVNRFRLNIPKNENGHDVSTRGHRLLGSEPEEHPPHLLPRALSDEHWDMIMGAGGVAGYDVSGDSSTHWHWKWDETNQQPVKFYPNKTSDLPAPKLTANAGSAKKPCSNCPDKKAEDV
jgi:hypothetical protein